MNVIIDELERKKSPGEVLDVLIPDEATLLGLDLDGILQDLEVYMTNKQKQLHESVRQLTSAPPIRWPISELQAIRGTLQEYLTPFEERETGSQDDGRLEKPAECSGEGEGYLVSDTSLETGEVRGRMSAKELLSQLKELDEKKARIMASISLLEKIQSLNDSLDTLREAMKDKDYAKINVLVDTINALAEVLGNQDELRDIIYRKELIFEDLKVCIKEELVTLMEARVQNGCHNGEQDISEASASLGPVVNPLAAVSVSGPFANRPESVARRGSGSLTLSNGIGGLLNSARKGTLAGLNAAGLGPRPSLDVLPNSAGARSSSGDLDGAQVSGAVAPSGNPQVVEAEALSSRLESVQLMCKLCRGVHSEPYTREENRIYDLIYQILLKLDSHLYDKIIADRINTILAEYEVQFDYKYNYKTKQDRINEALTQIKVFYKRLAWINHTLAAYKALLLPANLRSTTICAKKPVVNEDGIGSGVLNLFLIKFISVTKQHLINILDLAYTQIDHVQLYKLVVDVKQLQTLLDHIYDFHGTYKYDSATGQAAFSERSCSVKLPSLMNIFDAFTTPWLQNYDKSFSGVIRSAMNSKDEVEFFNDGTCSLYEGVGLALAHVPRRVFKSALSLSDSIVKMTQDAVRAGVAQMEQDTEITVTKYLNNYLDIGWITLSRWRKFILDENHPMRQSAGRLLDWNCTEMIEARTRTITQNYGNKLNIPRWRWSFMYCSLNYCSLNYCSLNYWTLNYCSLNYWTLNYCSLNYDVMDFANG
ncbi:hypothetical protein GNI_081530 [Gregarina niphandrodes]|uniref:Uncharacterized protein n=1 Tax=Gregarina niphandrodes TaxID=110365 RepID=A0A023B6A2_GRENI|nr:hypothetical protein GNI_081530 [Gregarina niphandrodes]EZG65916.1 hypothetical protein GNI_081530 [Gregarina niphandrodes]|eukprot:XP_011134028.1 hypothetical protein GNI_081530 [Gregarina niphandrodes]